VLGRRSANNPNNYPLAFYPQWDAAHPIHMIGHSQGGTTIRALVQLLEHGSPDGDEGGGELYRGGKTGWVKSVVTISAPHNGTTLRDAVLDVLPNLRSPLRDILDNRLAHWELAPDGAREFNRWALTSPGSIIFQWGRGRPWPAPGAATAATACIAPVQSSNYQYPRDDMIPYFKLFAGETIAARWRSRAWARTPSRRWGGCASTAAGSPATAWSTRSACARPPAIRCATTTARPCAELEFPRHLRWLRPLRHVELAEFGAVGGSGV
jgi:hypothetical protein